MLLFTLPLRLAAMGSSQADAPELQQVSLETRMSGLGNPAIGVIARMAVPGLNPGSP